MSEVQSQSFLIGPEATVEGTVPPTLSLTMGPNAHLGTFTPGVGRNYDTTMTANVISSAGDAVLSVTDPSTNGSRHRDPRLLVASVPFLTAGGLAVSVVVLIMLLASITLLPAFLSLAGPRIGGQGAGGRRLEAVSRHAVKYSIGATALQLALSAPALDLRLGSPDEGSLPTTRTERRAYDLVARGFGPGINGPLLVVADASRARQVRTEVAADPGVAFVGPPELSGGVATLLAYPTSAPQDNATVATIRRLRATVDAHVGGNTAEWADVGERLEERLPSFLGAVVLLSFLLLTAVFRSVLVPLKAAVLNLLGVGAAYGVLVVVFQWGWGAELIGLESTLPVVPFIPVFMFAILFGLSMDYEVFLLSRVREHYRRTGDNQAAVVEGIASTARVITSAALIMIAVFGGFVFDGDPRVKMFGLGLATAILVDATIVRLVLVPATMKLLGDANWWLPGWLGRMLPASTIQPLVRG